MKVDINKTYKTRLGRTAEIYKIIEGEYPLSWRVIGAIIELSGEYVPVTWTEEGFYDGEDAHHNNDLIECSPYEDYKIDERVIVWVTPAIKHKAHFAGLTAEGKPTTFAYGSTSWTSSFKDIAVWDYCKKV